MRVATLTTANAAAFFLMAIYTYHTCVASQQCPTLPRIPTLSNTWDHPPGNYISRFVLSITSLLFVAVQFSLWKPEEKKVKHAKLMLHLGLFSLLCLSFVGAICDDDKGDQCRGNDAIHSTSAIIFFMIYNAIMILLSRVSVFQVAVGVAYCVASSDSQLDLTIQRLANHRSSATLADFAVAAISLALLLILLLQIWRALCELWSVIRRGTFTGDVARLLSLLFLVNKSQLSQRYSPRSLGDVTMEAIPEIIDISIIMLWTTWYMNTERSSFVINAKFDGDSSPSKPIFFLSIGTASKAIKYLMVGNLVTSLYFFSKTMSDASVPAIDDLWIMPPGNWISRWSVVLTASLSLLCHCFLFTFESTIFGRLNSGLGIVSCLGLYVIGSVNKAENRTLHFAGVAFFFLTNNLWMLGISLRHTRKIFFCTLALSAFALSTVRICAVRLTSSDQPLKLVLVEWVQALVALTFFCSHVASLGSVRFRTGVRVFDSAEHGSGKESLLVIA